MRVWDKAVAAGPLTSGSTFDGARLHAWHKCRGSLSVGRACKIPTLSASLRSSSALSPHRFEYKTLPKAWNTNSEDSRAVINCSLRTDGISSAAIQNATRAHNSQLLDAIFVPCHVVSAFLTLLGSRSNRCASASEACDFTRGEVRVASQKLQTHQRRPDISIGMGDDDVYRARRRSMLGR